MLLSQVALRATSSIVPLKQTVQVDVTLSVNILATPSRTAGPDEHCVHFHWQPEHTGYYHYGCYLARYTVQLELRYLASDLPRKRTAPAMVKLCSFEVVVALFL